MFNKKWISKLPENPILAIKTVALLIIETDRNLSLMTREKHYTSYLDFLAFIELHAKEHELKIHLPGLSEDKRENINRIIEFCYTLVNIIDRNLTRVLYQNSRNKIKTNSGLTLPHDDDLSEKQKIQILINELRSIISDSYDFENNHQYSLLKKLEKFQSTLHSEDSISDRIYRQLDNLFT